VFCPNCGTQNPETAATCTKCNFNLKGAAAPKFKGTMLMMNNPGVTPAVPRPPTPVGAAPPPGAPLGDAGPGGPPAPMPSKLKGTMVGVAPPMGIPPTPPRPPSIPPADVPPPPAFVTSGQPALGTPPPFPAPPGPVNPLGGTIAAGDANPFAYGAPPPAQAAPQQGGSGGFGGGGYGQPNQGPGGPGDFGGGMGQGGPPAFGAPPPQQQQPQDWGAPPMQQQQQPMGMGGMGMGGPQNQGQQGPGMMSPYGQPPQGMMGPQGQAMVQGGHGPKGQVRNGTMELVYSFVSCGLYQAYYYMRAAQEMNTYLGREAVPFWKLFLLTSVTCGLYGLYWQATQCGALVQEMEQRAGIPNPQNLGILYVVPYYNMIVLQAELNKVWQAPG
jgi:zinc-ribbon domain